MDIPLEVEDKYNKEHLAEIKLQTCKFYVFQCVFV